MPNPLRSEADAFRILLYVVGVVVVLVVAAAVIRAVS
jgi:hypothetical protein